MAEKYIKVRGKLVAVTEDIYYAYYHMARQCRTQAEKDRRNRVASYDALDTDDGLGIELLVDEVSPGVEETVVSHILVEKLHRCLAQLPRAEQNLLSALYLQGWSERKLAECTGTPYMTIHDRKIRALKKLRKMMEK